MSDFAGGRASTTGGADGAELEELAADAELVEELAAEAELPALFWEGSSVAP